MKLTFRTTLLSILLTLLLFAVGGVGLSSYWNAHSTAQTLSAQVIEQTSLHIDSQIQNFLNAATAHASLNRRLLEADRYPLHDFPPLAAYWLEEMKVRPELTRVTLGLEATGEWFYVRRLDDGKLAIGELRRGPQSQKLELSNFWPDQYPRGSRFFFDSNMEREDPRRRAWYIAAKTAGRQVWTESYVFFGVGGVADAPGVSCAAPVNGPDGELQGVLTASISLNELCRFLHGVTVGRNGFAFVVEFRKDGSRRVIAHPDADKILHVVSDGGSEPIRELVPAEKIDDPRVRAFMTQLPAEMPCNTACLSRVSFQQNGVSYLGSFSRLRDEGSPNWLICTVVPELDVMGDVYQSNRVTLVFGLAICLAATLLSMVVSRQVARRLERLSLQTEAIGRLEIEPRPVEHSMVEEVDRLAVATEEMKTGLRSFRKYVPADLVRYLLKSGREAELGGERRALTMFFCDIADFTTISERMTPENLVTHLGEYLQALSGQVLATGGTVDKYIGDAIMAFWGAPMPNAGHALAACIAAVRCQEVLVRLRPQWEAAGKPPFRARIGLHTGEVVVGNIGSVERLNYTVIGDAVNLASRLEGLNKYYGTTVMISETTYREAGAGIVARPVDWVAVKGKTEAVLVYELLGLKGEVGPEVEAFAALYREALGEYRGRNWPAAQRLFEEVLCSHPDDEPAQEMIRRCQLYQEQPPDAAWDGVHHLEGK